MNKPTAKHYGVIGSDSVIRAYPADETDAYIAHLEQRAEAAEAKLAELEKQEPVAVVARREPTLLWEWTKQGKSIDRPDGMYLYARPAPAINLAALVPGASSMILVSDYNLGRRDGWNDCRAAILRNIEEAKTK